MTTTTNETRGVSSDLADILGLIPGYDPFATAGECWFDEERALDALDFFPACLSHVKGALARKPLDLAPWQQSIVANLFGWIRPDGTRRYREVFVYVPRKNGKTTLAAGLVNYVLFCEGEAGAELYSAAADRDQATLVYEPAKQMVLADSELRRRAKPYATSKSIVVIDPDTGQETGSFYKAISADANTKHGYNSHMFVVDELHAQPDSELVDVLETSTGSRTQPIALYITTADFARPSICNEKLDYARKVRDGIINDPAYLPVIYEVEVDADWKDPKVWAAANPNLGVSLSEDYLRAKCEKAKQSPRFENTFKRLHLNIQTEQDVRWLSMDAWDACGELQFVPEELRGRACYAALDLSSKVDLSCLGLLFPDDEVGYYYLCWFFCPAENKRAREKKDGVCYSDWIRQGHIVATAGNVIDYKAIRSKLLECRGMFNIREVAVDPWNAQQLSTELGEDHGFEVIEYRQGYVSMSGPAKDFEAAILSRKFQHGGNPVLRWMASNVCVKEDPAENIKPIKSGKTGNKRGQSSRRIDGIITAVMCLGRAQQGGGDKPSVYETGGIVYV